MFLKITIILSAVELEGMCMSMVLHFATTIELLNRARSVREQVFTIEKKIPKSIEVDELDCLNDRCDHFVVELVEQEESSANRAILDEAEARARGNELIENKLIDNADICALRCKRIDDKGIQLQRFCVLKEYRGVGVGRFALEQIENYYWAKGIEVITLDAKFHVSEFYEKCGYVVVSEPFMEADLLHVVMEKRRKQG